MKRDIDKLAKRLQKELTDNILNRYDNSEYWDNGVIDTFLGDNHISEIEAKKIYKILGI